MAQVHLWVGLAVIALNGAAGAWGAIAWLRREPSVWFWYVLRAAQVAVVLQALLGMVMVASGVRPGNDLHLVYGLLPLVVTLVSEALRVTAVTHETEGIDDVEALPRDQQIGLARLIVRRETGIMTVGALLILGLALRAYFVA
jgi:heme A synthase